MMVAVMFGVMVGVGVPGGREAETAGSNVDAGLVMGVP
jgi:hypothetical protein